MGNQWFNLLRARVRTLAEGWVQAGRVEVHANHATDGVERWQDYGFAAQPVEGHGLLIEAGGTSILLRVDRATERPTLAAHEVTVWHKDGARITLRDGQLVEVNCARLVINATESVEITSPDVMVTASVGVSLDTPAIEATGDLALDGGATIGAGLAVTGALTDNGVDVGSTHAHSYLDDNGSGGFTPRVTGVPS